MLNLYYLNYLSALYLSDGLCTSKWVIRLQMDGLGITTSNEKCLNMQETYKGHTVVVQCMPDNHNMDVPWMSSSVSLFPMVRLFA